MPRRGLVGGCAVGFAAGWNIANTGAAANELSEAYAVGLGAVGLLTTALFIVHMLMQLPSGRLSDRLGPWPVCATGVVVLAACNGALALSASMPLATAVRALAGVGTALAFIGGSDLVRLSGGTPLTQGIYGGVATAGGGAALGIVPLVTGTADWRAPYLTGIAVALLAAVLLAGAPRPSRARSRPATVALRGIAGDTRLLRLAIVFSASFGLSVALGNWVAALLEERVGASASVAGLTASLTLALGVVSRPFGGWIMRQRPAALGIAVTASALVGAAGTIAVAVGSLPVAIAGAAAIGLAAGIPFAAAFTGAAVAIPGSPAAAVGFVNGAGALTILVVTPIVGAALDREAGPAAFIALAVVWAASAGVVPTVFGRGARTHGAP